MEKIVSIALIFFAIVFLSGRLINWIIDKITGDNHMSDKERDKFCAQIGVRWDATMHSVHYFTDISSGSLGKNGSLVVLGPLTRNLLEDRVRRHRLAFFNAKAKCLK